ncbi:HEAT repeat domain-containing protein [Streptomyces vinaceus]|uniref:HEAT repeat domain-containing protein n=1 Tax=Streptomyces vinaceus TaxID=1960 RepID=UPI003810CB59
MCLPGSWPRRPATPPSPPCCGPTPAIWATTRPPSTRLRVLAQAHPAAAREILLPCAVSDDEDLRRAAIWLLGFVPEPADLDLLAHAARDADEGIRSAVVGTLGSHGTEPAAIDLLLCLLDDPSPQVRISALSSA